MWLVDAVFKRNGLPEFGVLKEPEVTEFAGIADADFRAGPTRPSNLRDPAVVRGEPGALTEFFKGMMAESKGGGGGAPPDGMLVGFDPVIESNLHASLPLAPPSPCLLLRRRTLPIHAPLMRVEDRPRKSAVGTPARVEGLWCDHALPAEPTRLRRGEAHHSLVLDLRNPWVENPPVVLSNPNHLVLADLTAHVPCRSVLVVAYAPSTPCPPPLSSPVPFPLGFPPPPLPSLLFPQRDSGRCGSHFSSDALRQVRV